MSAVLGAVCLWIGLRYLADNRMPDFRRNYVLYVYPDTEAGAAIDSISAGADVIREGSLVRCARKENLTERIKPGRYEIGPSMSAVYVVRMLCNGWQSPQKLTLSGTIRSRGRLASVIDRQMMVDSVTVDSLLGSNEFLSRFGFDTTDVFALFLPDTYYMYWTASPEEIFTRFRKEYDAFWTTERLAKAEALGLTPLEVSTLASIVNGETLPLLERMASGHLPPGACLVNAESHADRFEFFAFASLHEVEGTLRQAGIPLPEGALVPLPLNLEDAFVGYTGRR